MTYERLVRDLLGRADITIGGGRDHDIVVHDPRFYKKFLKHGRLGLGEAYMDGWWDCPRVDEFTRHIYHSDLDGFSEKASLADMATLIRARFAPDGSRARAQDVAHVHYNVGNELFATMLDRRMMYSCPIWDDAGDTLDQAQEKKLERICRKLGLQAGMRVLDIGCGWGGFAQYAAEKHGVDVVGISIAEEQIALARDTCTAPGLSFHVMDYRDVPTLGRFDRIVSIGMFEHVGLAFYRAYFEVAASVLAEDGLFLLHTNTLRDSRYSSPWLTKYIFPGGFVPSLSQVTQPMEGLFFVEHAENIGFYYYRTFLAWYDNFVRGWDGVKDSYDQRFFRMWSYYLLTVAAGYEARYVHVHQLVLAGKGRQSAYQLP